MGKNRKIALKLLFIVLISTLLPSCSYGQKEGVYDSLRYRYGTNYVELKASNSLSGSFTLNLPTADGSSGQFMQTDGSGNLSFATVSASGNPAGTMILFTGTSCPSGTLEANGSTISRATYSDLFSAIGTAWGNGDGSTTFHLPDLRGRFARGHDGGAGNDPDRASRSATNSGGNTGDNVGSLQGDENKSHAHYVYTDNSTFYVVGTGGKRAATAGDAAPDNSGLSGGNEARPKNVYVKYCVYY